MDNTHIIISLGGSMVVPDLPDSLYVKNFVSLINEYVKKDFKFIIIVGGGKICRNYQNALKEIRNVSNEELDILGVHSTVFNAQFVRMSFGENAYKEVLQGPDNLLNVDSKIIIGAGWKSGNSTDLIAILSAEKVGAKKVINLSNIDYAYNKDPNKFSDAVKIEHSSWADFRAILPKEWNPGLNAPFDPIAALKAESEGIEVAIMNGKNLENLKNYLDGQSFIGTVIR